MTISFKCWKTHPDNKRRWEDILLDPWLCVSLRELYQSSDRQAEKGAASIETSGWHLIRLCLAFPPVQLVKLNDRYKIGLQLQMLQRGDVVTFAADFACKFPLGVNISRVPKTNFENTNNLHNNSFLFHFWLIHLAPCRDNFFSFFIIIVSNFNGFPVFTNFIESLEVASRAYICRSGLKAIW